MGWIVRTAGVGLLAVATVACGSARTDSAARDDVKTTLGYEAGPADSPYWIAGWLPEGAVPESAHGQSDSESTISYMSANGPNHRDPFLWITVTHVGPRADGNACDPRMIVKGEGTVRGHRACSRANTDDGREYGWAIDWQETDALHIRVQVSPPEKPAEARPIAERIAESVRPVSERAWQRLVTMTTGVSGVAVVALPATRLADGTIAGKSWTLDAVIPPQYPLGPDDRRSPCAKFTYGGDARVECFDGPGGGSRYARFDEQVFVFGVVDQGIRRVRVRNSDRETREHPLEVVATVDTFAALPVAQRFFASPIPSTSCGVIVFDDAHPDDDRVGFAPALPSDGAPCALDVSCQTRTLTTLPPTKSATNTTSSIPQVVDTVPVRCP